MYVISWHCYFGLSVHHVQICTWLFSFRALWFVPGLNWKWSLTRICLFEVDNLRQRHIWSRTWVLCVMEDKVSKEIVFFTHLIYWIGEGSRTHRRADCLWETLFGGLSLSLPPELHTQWVPNPGDMIGWVLQVCGFRLAETSDYFSHVVDLCGGDEETLKPPRHYEEEICLPHRGNLEWAWSLSTICCTSVTRRTGHFVFVLFLTLVSVMKHSWPVQTLRWTKQVSWVGQSTQVTS